MKPGELEWLSNHMGHEVNIHKQSYRLHTTAVEIAKVGRMLMSIDSGVSKNFHGRKISQLNISGSNSYDVLGLSTFEFVCRSSVVPHEVS